jgi:hypothetical protein
MTGTIRRLPEHDRMPREETRAGPSSAIYLCDF